MNPGQIAGLVAVVSMFLLVVDASPLWVLTLILASAYYGWDFGRRYLPRVSEV